jgi:hypothetical protein
VSMAPLRPALVRPDLDDKADARTSRRPGWASAIATRSQCFHWGPTDVGTPGFATPSKVRNRPRRSNRRAVPRRHFKGRVDIDAAWRHHPTAIA